MHVAALWKRLQIRDEDAYKRLQKTEEKPMTTRIKMELDAETAGIYVR
jgi:hypothetical protein